MIMGFSARLQLLLLSGAGAVFCFFLEVLFGVLGVLLLGCCFVFGVVSGTLGCWSTGAVLVYWGCWSTGAVLIYWGCIGLLGQLVYWGCVGLLGLLVY